MTTVISNGYAVVDAGDATGLITAINAGNAAGSTQYNIFLQSGTYSLYSTQSIFGNVRIFGRGVDVTIIRQGERNIDAMGGIFAVNSGSTLTLQSLTVKDGLAQSTTYGATAGAAVKVWAGQLTVQDCKFENNIATLYGGAIYNGNGQVLVQRTVFVGNKAQSGGAITSSSTITPALTVDYCRFTANQATDYGAVLLVGQNGSAINITNSSILADNIAGVNYNHIYNSAPSASVSASNNYWAPTPLVSSGVTTSPTQATDPTSSMPVNSPESKMTNELSWYGITAYPEGNSPASQGKAWTLDELREVVIGVYTTARAFQLLRNYGSPTGTGGIAQVQFQTIMQTFKILRVNNGFQIAANDGCNGTQNQACTSNDFGAVMFFGAVSVNQYTVVHELGHRFDNRSAQGGKDSLAARLGAGASYGGVNILDCSNNIVLGTISNDWTRGDRGWGSGPAFSTFQQNPLKQTGKTSAEIYEAAGDMFLNWVYRRGTDVAPATDPCTSPLTGNWQGFLNVSWIGTSNPAGTSDTMKPGNKRYKWTEDTLKAIWTDHPSWY